MMVEDHPFSYRDFEGAIPEGNYGAGEVIVWDTGTFTVEGATTKKEIEQKVLEGIESGDVKLILNGAKAKGKYALVRFKKAGDNAWLLIKEKDDFVGSDLIENDKSVKSGKTLDDIKDQKKNDVWSNNVVKPMLAELVFNLPPKTVFKLPEPTLSSPAPMKPMLPLCVLPFPPRATDVFPDTRLSSPASVAPRNPLTLLSLPPIMAARVEATSLEYPPPTAA